MISHTTTSPGRRKFFGAIALAAAALAAAAADPLSLFRRKGLGANEASPSVAAFTPNPLAVQRTQKGAAHHG